MSLPRFLRADLVCALVVASVSLAAPALAQPATESARLAERVYGLDLERVNVSSISALIEAQTQAEALANRGDARAAELVRYVVLLRQLAQVQDPNRAELVNARGERIGDDPKREAQRLKAALSALRAGRPIPAEAPKAAPGNEARVRDLLNRELSFLEFNRRVLAQAGDAKVPALERLRFLTIASSNLDEFFKIRVAGLQEDVKAGRTAPRSDGFRPDETLRQILSENQKLVDLQHRLLQNEVLPLLAREGVKVERDVAAFRGQRAWVLGYLQREVFPKLEVIPLSAGEALPRLHDGRVNLLVRFQDGGRAVVQIPPSLPGSVQLPGAGTRYALLSDLVRSELTTLFKGRRVAGATNFRVTRNGDLWGRTGVAARYGEAVRLEVESSTSSATRNELARGLGVPPKHVVTSSGPIDLTRLGEVIDVERADLKYEGLKGVRPRAVAPGADLFTAIGRGDVLLHHPFHSYDPVVEFLEQAARDANVKRIRQTLYRTGGADKGIVQALVAAAQAGKEVTVLVETRARFDELNNSGVTEALKKAGAKVVFGPPGLKTHGKALLIERMESGRLVRYTHMGTGNYNPGTAKIYTDFSYFTKSAAIGADLDRVFNQLETKERIGEVELNKLLQAPFSLQDTLLARIEAEIAEAKAGRPARITAKMNSLNDPKLIRALYRASQAGVQVDLIVRGVTTLKPGVPGLSENIRVRSLVGRFLEHTRVFSFHDAGRGTTYLASADWMVRNTERRVELAIPVEEPKLKAELRDALSLYLRDNTKAWELRANGSYERLSPAEGAKAVNAQEELARRRGTAPVDQLAAYRRGDGTLEWKRLTRDGVLRNTAGVAHFALALFLKEVAVVVATGDRARIEEFFDGLMTTDFYKHYGLFVAGARVGELAYTRYLQRFVRPRFVNGLLKTNLVLAAGLALPMIVEGEFSGKVFAISLGSLGLSSTAVRGGVAGIRWVRDLSRAKQAGALARAGQAGRLARLGGWFYTAAELAVILYVAEKVETRVHAHLDREAAKDALGEAGATFLAAVNAPGASVADVSSAVADYHQAWSDYRGFLYRGLEVAEARFAHRLEGLGRKAKQLSDERDAALARLGDNPSLKPALRRAITDREARAQDEIGEAVKEAFAAYEAERKELLDAVYQGPRRAGGLFEGLKHKDWLLAGAPVGVAADPFRRTIPVWARLGRRRAAADLHKALRSGTHNRLQTYADEAEVLRATADHLRASGKSAHARALESALQIVERTRVLDERLAAGQPILDVDPAKSATGLDTKLQGVR